MSTLENRLATGIVLKNPSELKPNPKNPNTHTELQIERIGKIIKEQGWRSPIVVSQTTGFVVAGHGRLEAAKKLGLTQVPVSIQKFDSEAQEYAHMLADNRLAELADMDNTKLKDLIQELDTGEIDLELTGYSNSEIGSLMSQVFQGENGPTPIEDLETFESTAIRQIVLICNIEEFESAIAKLDKIKTKLDLQNNTEVVLHLLEQYDV